ncbi:MAG: malectin domain-containing carbohydrate-binding protein, partial [Mastigocoleus sp.]
EAEDYKAGTNGVEYFDTTPGNGPGAYRNDDVDIETTGDIEGGFNVGSIDTGEYLTYDVLLPAGGEYNIVLRLATGSGDGKSIGVTIGEETYTANFSNTGGFQTYEDIVISGVTLNAGEQELRLDMTSNSFNINYIDLVPVTIIPDETVPTAELDITSLIKLPNSTTTANFTVTFTDNAAIDSSSINENDITVIAPDGVTELPITLVGVDISNDGTPRTANYSIAAPGGTWDVSDSGDYTVAITGEISDTSSNNIELGNLGNLNIDVSTPASDGVIRINSGADQDAVDSNGKLWQADASFSGGQSVGPVTNSIADTIDDFIYQSQRSGNNFSYSIPVADGNYNVNLHLAELNFTDFEERLFDVSVEGDLVLDDLDIYGETRNAFLDGTNTANILEIPDLAIVRDGTIDLNFTSVLEDAAIAGIEIVPLEGPQVLIQESEQKTRVIEGGNVDTYQVFLNTQPSSDVTINFQLDDQVNVDQSSLVFTPSNWDTPQTVTVNAVNDTLEESFHTSEIGHTITTTDSAYSNLSIPSVSVNIVDDDLPEVKFDKKTVAITALPSVGAWGPDGRLYVGALNGEIKVYTFDDNYNVIDEQLIDTLTGVSNNNILGIAFNPYENTGTGEPKIYVSHSELYANNNGGGFDELTEFSPYSGQVSVLEGPDFSVAQPLVENIGVSNHDHGVNGLAFDDEGNLLITVGGNTNAGIADDSVGGLEESPFTTAILKAEITKPDFNGDIQYELPADWVPPEGLTLPNPEESQGFGGIVNVADGVDISVYASGFRNPFDLEYATTGIIYATENGANSGFGDASTGADTQEPFVLQVTDELNIIEEDGYYGHPNRNRGRTDARQNVYYSPDDPSNSGYTAPIAAFDASTNGITEYRSTAFNSQLRGNLLAQQWNGILYNIELSADGTQVSNISFLETEVGSDEYAADGLDVLTGPGGAIVGIDFSAGEITVSTPVDELVTNNMVAYDISSWRAPASGGGEFVIGGDNFSGSIADTTVTIGDEVASITSVSDNRITGIFPSFTPSGDNLLDVTVESNGQVSAITDAFQPLFI